MSPSISVRAVSGGMSSRDSGNETRRRSGSTPLRCAATCAAAVARSRNSLRSRWAGFGLPIRLAGRRQQAIGVVAHRAHGRDRREVGGALELLPPARGAADRRQQQGDEDEHERRPEDERQRLAGRVARSGRQPAKPASGARRGAAARVEPGERAAGADPPSGRGATRALSPRSRMLGRPRGRPASARRGRSARITAAAAPSAGRAIAPCHSRGGRVRPRGRPRARRPRSGSDARAPRRARRRRRG